MKKSKIQILPILQNKSKFSVCRHALAGQSGRPACRSALGGQSGRQISKFASSSFFIVTCTLVLLCHLYFDIRHPAFAQEKVSEFILDVNSSTVPLPGILKPSIDLSGRGLSRNGQRPQTLATQEVIDAWKKEIGFIGIYRVQFNLWEIIEASKDKDKKESLIRSYDAILKDITDSGAVVILDIFGTPATMGKVLDKRSSPQEPAVFKELIKKYIKQFSCDKRYNIWYEVWNAPDLDDFFLGRKQDYLNIYRAVAEAVKELEKENKIHIPIGGPSVSWWFQATDGNTIATPEKSLIYSLIRFCYSYRLPLDFVSWHAYSTDPKVDNEATIYVRKNNIKLIRDWLSYFHFNRHTPLIIDEWNFDSGANIVPERAENSHIASSFIPARLVDMYKAGLDFSCFFALEDIQDNKEGVIRNIGAFRCDSGALKYYKVEPKSIFNAFLMMAKLGNEVFVSSFTNQDEFVGFIATKNKDKVVILVYNYIDPGIATNFLSRNISNLEPGQRKVLLNIVKANKLNKILLHETSINSLRVNKVIKNLLKKAVELKDLALAMEGKDRVFKLILKNLKGGYVYQRYTLDSSCSVNCEFSPRQTKEVNMTEQYEEKLELKPYSVSLIMLSPKPKEAEKTIEQAPGPQSAEPVITANELKK